MNFILPTNEVSGHPGGGPSPVLSTGEVAEHLGIATHLLRHWEPMGSWRPPAGAARRRYCFTGPYRIVAVLRAQEAGFSLEDIVA